MEAKQACDIVHGISRVRRIGETVMKSILAGIIVVLGVSACATADMATADTAVSEMSEKPDGDDKYEKNDKALAELEERKAAATAKE
jgi:hypothetical protein